MAIEILIKPNGPKTIKPTLMNTYLIQMGLNKGALINSVLVVGPPMALSQVDVLSQADVLLAIADVV